MIRPLTIMMLVAMAQTVLAQPVTQQITYQGSLNDTGLPAEGLYDFEFQLWNDPNTGSQVGSTAVFDDLPVVDGVFTATLDFGPGVFSGGDRWLLIRVRAGASVGGFTELLPRQMVTPAPFAISAQRVPAQSITMNEIAPGAVGPGQIAMNAVTSVAIASAAVESDELADQSVTSDKLGLGSVQSEHIADGEIKGVDVDDTEIQLRIDAVCPSGQYIRGIQFDGSVICQPVSDEITYVRVVDTTMNYPGAGLFKSFGQPSLSNGAVVFFGQLDEFPAQCLDECGIFHWVDGASTIVADKSTPIPGGSGNFMNFDGNPSHYFGTIAFIAEGSLQQGIYLDRGQGLQVVADLTTPIPDGTGNFTLFDNVYVGDDCLAFSARGAGQEGIYMYFWDTDQMVMMANLSTPIPGGSGTFTSFRTLGGLGGRWPTVHEDDVTFVASGNSGQEGVYKIVNGVVSVVADRTTSVPGGVGAFTNFQAASPIIYNETVVFAGTFNDGGDRYGSYTDRTGGLTVLYDQSTIAPDSGLPFTGTFVQLGRDGENVVFLGSSPGVSQGIYTDISGSLETVINTTGATLLDGRVPSSMGVYTEGISGNQVAVNVVLFVGGDRGMYLATMPLSFPYHYP